MALQVISSNSNSSLLNSLTSSPAMVNPLEYALGQITPFHSKLTVKHTPVSGNLTANTSNRFALNKFGVISKMILSFKVNRPAVAGETANTVKNSYYGILEAIDSMTQMSSSRVIHTLTKESIKAIISDLPTDTRNAVIRGLQGVDTGDTSGNAIWAAGETCYIPCFFPTLSNPKLYIDSEFVEPMSVQINFSNKSWSGYAKVVAGTTTKHFSRPAITDMTLYVDYLNFSASERDALLSKNYVDDTLSMLTYDYDSSESPGEGDVALGADATSKCKTFIKNTGSISDIYVYAEVESNPVEPAEIQQTNSPLILEDIKLFASGQELVNVEAKLIQLFGKTATNGDFFDSKGFDTTDPSRNIYKIQLGLNSSNGDQLGNAMSLRELNNVYVEANVSKGATGYNGTANNTFKPVLRVILKKVEIVTIDASNGRLTKTVNT